MISSSACPSSGIHGEFSRTRPLVPKTVADQSEFTIIPQSKYPIAPEGNFNTPAAQWSTRLFFPITAVALTSTGSWPATNRMNDTG